ncbi:UNVERIFIED_CONTAM: RHS repeat-associated protein [Acetivibrio alkalicellulosi]
MVLEVNGAGQQVGRNIYGTNLLMRAVDNESYYYMYNGHADVTALINTTTGVVAATYYYDAFGNILDQTGNVNNNITYAGYQWDKETGLYYLNARMYDPKIARFLQEDTYRGDPRDPLSLNLYSYCHNEPIMYYDPTGYNNIAVEYGTDLLKYITGAGATLYYHAKAATPAGIFLFIVSSPAPLADDLTQARHALKYMDEPPHIMEKLESVETAAEFHEILNTWYRQQYRLQRWQSTKPSFIQEYIDKANAPTMPSHIRSYYDSGTNWRTKEDNVIVDTFPQDPTLNKRVLDNPFLQDPTFNKRILDNPFLQDPALNRRILDNPFLQDPTLNRRILDNPFPEVGTIRDNILVANINYNKYLRGLIGAPPSEMVDPHAHHILFKLGLGVAQKELVKEGQELLRRYGIDPVMGREVLVWAPNRVVGQHGIEALKHVVDKLKEVEEAGGDYDDIVEMLKELGEQASRRR